jgi:hypothetical protein
MEDEMTVIRAVSRASLNELGNLPCSRHPKCPSSVSIIRVQEDPTTVIFLLILLTLAGYIAGHGWFFTNLGYEHRVNDFFTDLEKKDYAAAYGLYNADANWQQHPAQYSGYPLSRFTEDWTSASPVHGPILSHHIDVSKSDGSGAFGTGIIVAVKINGDKEVFMYVNRADKTMTWPAPHELTRY